MRDIKEVDAKRKTCPLTRKAGARAKKCNPRPCAKWESTGVYPELDYSTNKTVMVPYGYCKLRR